jgi:hypothetical protein
MEPRQKQFYDALRQLIRKIASPEEVTESLQSFADDETLDVNLYIVATSTPLHVAVQWQSIAVFHWLLRHPRIDVNRLDYDGVTALTYSSDRWNDVFFETLMARPDIDVNADQNENNNPLFGSRCYENRIKVLIAAGIRPLKYLTIDMPPENSALLVRHKNEPLLTRWQCQRQLHYPGPAAAVLFVAVLAIGDYLQLRPMRGDYVNYRCFFALIGQLPTELQMLLCRRVYGLNGWLIRDDDLCLALAKFSD